MRTQLLQAIREIRVELRTPNLPYDQQVHFEYLIEMYEEELRDSNCHRPIFSGDVNL